jgi:hypothetical protein
MQHKINTNLEGPKNIRQMNETYEHVVPKLHSTEHQIFVNLKH